MSGASTAVLVLTRWPEPGRVKTRLIPALGPEGAAELHREMADAAIGRAWSFCAGRPGARLTVACAGGSPGLWSQWLGSVPSVPQGEGDLGRRLQRAAEGAFASGARRVLMIGTDCPSLAEDTLAAAAAALESVPVVFGPAHDGGYYLVGMATPFPTLFAGIPWGTAGVLEASLAAARAAGCEPSLLPPLPDVDVPEDLPAARRALGSARTVSVIGPGPAAPSRSRRWLSLLEASGPHEVLLSGRCGDEGAGTGANEAAAAATGEFLIFLPGGADPPPGLIRRVRESLGQPGVAGGLFGEGGVCVRRHVFRFLGGFSGPDPHQAFLRRLERLGEIVRLPRPGPGAL